MTPKRNNAATTWTISSPSQEGALLAAQRDFPDALIVSVKALGLPWNRKHEVTMRRKPTPSPRPQPDQGSWVFTDAGKQALLSLEADLEAPAAVKFEDLLAAATPPEELTDFSDGDLIPLPVLPKSAPATDEVVAMAPVEDLTPAPQNSTAEWLDDLSDLEEEPPGPSGPGYL